MLKITIPIPSSISTHYVMPVQNDISIIMSKLFKITTFNSLERKR